MPRVVRARIDVENNEISLEDTDVKAPITGVIIQKGVERGQVVASATFNAGGGTVLMKMADLNLVQVRTLVDETDIGKIKAGQATTVTVDAYPNRPFQGEVLKIEPLAEVQQNVTMFPVLVRIDNREGLLRPGMNSEVEIHVGRRDSVLAVPERGAPHPEGRGVGGRCARPQHGAGAIPSSPRQDQPPPQGDTAASRQVSLGAGAGQRLRRLPRASPRAPRQHHDDARWPRGEAARRGHREAGARDLRQVPERRAADAGGARRSCRRCGSSTGAGRAVVGSGRRATTTSSAGTTSSSSRRPTGRVPRAVRTGLTDLDYSEVVSGLKAGDSVLVLPSASLINSQQEFKNRIQSMTGGGVPGMRQTTTRRRPVVAAAAGAGTGRDGKPCCSARRLRSRSSPSGPTSSGRRSRCWAS